MKKATHIAPDARSMMWVMATLAVAVSLQLVRMPIWILVITVLPFIWRIASELKRWPPIPTVGRFIALGIALLILLFSFGNVFGRTAAVSLLAVMLSMKLLETYRIRDARVVVSFSIFLCATQFLFGQGVLMPFYGAAVIALSLIALAHLHRREAFAPSRAVPALGRSIYAELGFGFRIVALALPVALVLFLLFPRWASPLWGVPESSLDARTGLSDTMSPGTIQQLFMDDSPAFRVTFHGRVPRQEELYWRGPVLWEFDGQEWQSSFLGRNVEARNRPEAENVDYAYTVQLEPNERKWLFALDYPATVPADTRLTLDFQLIRKNSVTQLLRYDVASDADFRDSPELSDVLRAGALQLPQGLNSRTRELVDSWRASTSSDLALAQRILRHFNEEEFHYRLDPPLLGLNSVDDFLFRTRSGYCEHYASAFTVMMRMAGVPARVVTGYQGGWYNEFGQYLLVRQSDAHAWSEIWLEGEGWRRIDPTAAVSPLRVQQGSLDALSEPRHMFDFDWLRTAKNGFDVLQRNWNEMVIDFGAAEQKRLFVPFGLEDIDAGGLMAILLVVVALVALLMLPLALRIQGPMKRSALQSAWLKFIKRLDRAGVPTRPSMGAIDVAQQARVVLPHEAGEIDRIAGLYNRYRYSPSPPDLKAIKRAVRRFRPKRTVRRRVWT